MSIHRNARKVAVSLFFACLTAALASLSGCAGDLYEPHYSGFSGPYYTGPMDSSTAKAGQVAYSSQKFTVVWNKDCIADSFVSINLYRGNSFLDDISASFRNTGEYEGWEFPEELDHASNYRILIMSKSNSEDYLYTPFISLMPYTQIDYYEPDNEPGRANRLEPDNSVQMHSISSADVDWFYFIGDARLYFAIQIFGAREIQVRALDKNRDTIIGMTLYDFSDKKKIALECDDGDTVYFRVSLNSDAVIGSYQVSVAPYKPLGAVQIKHPGKGIVLTPGASDTLVWETSDNDAYVSIKLLDSTVVVYTISNSTLNRGFIYWTVPRGLDSSRAYRIMISDAGIFPAAYFSDTFSISLRPDDAEPDNSPEQAGKLGQGEVVGIRTITPNDSDWFAFTAKEGRVYVIASTGYTDMRLSLYGRDGAAVLRKSDDGYSGGRNARILWICDTAGQYYVMARGFSSATTGPYGLTLDTVSTPVLTVEAPAPICTTGTSVRIVLKSSAPPGALIRIDLVHDSIARNIVTQTDYINNTYWSIGQDIKSGSDFRIKAAYVSDTSIYALSSAFQIVSIADDYEPDNSMGEADTSIVFGEMQQHTLAPNDSDWVAFHATEGRRYSIGITGINSVYLLLYSEDGKSIISTMKTSANDEDAKITWICRESGVYYALVCKYTTVTTIRNYGIVIFED